MKFYTVPVSPNCRKAESTIYHLDLDVEIIQKDIMSGELNKEDYLRINPNGMVPALEDGEFKLWESNAIMQYLADKARAEEFFPKNFKQRMSIVKWQFWGALHFNRSVGTICWETVAKPAFGLGDPDQSAIDFALDGFHCCAKILNQQLNSTDFIVGNSPTLADFSVGDHSALALNEHSQIPLDEYSNIKSWYQRLEEIPGWEKTRPSF